MGHEQCDGTTLGASPLPVVGVTTEAHRLNLWMKTPVICTTQLWVMYVIWKWIIEWSFWSLQYWLVCSRFWMPKVNQNKCMSCLYWTLFKFEIINFFFKQENLFLAFIIANLPSPCKKRYVCSEYGRLAFFSPAVAVFARFLYCNEVFILLLSKIVEMNRSSRHHCSIASSEAEPCWHTGGVGGICGQGIEIFEALITIYWSRYQERTLSKSLHHEIWSQ